MEAVQVDGGVPEGMYWDPVTKQWMSQEPGLQDSSFLPYGAEDWINPQGWSRMVAKKILSNGAKAAVGAGIKAAAKEGLQVGAKTLAREGAQVEGNFLAREGAGIVNRLRNSGVSETALKDLAKTAASGNNIELATNQGLQGTLRVGDPTHGALAEYGRQLADEGANVIDYGTKTISKRSSVPGGDMVGAAKMRTQQVLDMLKAKNGDEK